MTGLPKVSAVFSRSLGGKLLATVPGDPDFVKVFDEGKGAWVPFTGPLGVVSDSIPLTEDEVKSNKACQLLGSSYLEILLKYRA